MPSVPKIIILSHTNWDLQLRQSKYFCGLMSFSTVFERIKNTWHGGFKVPDVYGELEVVDINL